MRRWRMKSEPPDCSIDDLTERNELSMLHSAAIGHRSHHWRL